MRRLAIFFIELLSVAMLAEPEPPETAIAPMQQEAQELKVEREKVPEVLSKERSYVITPDDLETEAYWDSMELLAVCVEAEAGNQSLAGRRMVVDVILNRLDDSSFPDTIEGVITQPGQFQAYWDGGMERVKEPSELTLQAVQMELEQRSYPGLFFFCSSGFSKYGTPWQKVGDHYFSTK